MLQVPTTVTHIIYSKYKISYTHNILHNELIPVNRNVSIYLDLGTDEISNFNQFIKLNCIAVAFMGIIFMDSKEYLQNNKITMEENLDVKTPIKQLYHLDGKYFIVIDNSIIERLKLIEDSNYFSEEVTADGQNYP